MRLFLQQRGERIQYGCPVSFVTRVCAKCCSQRRFRRCELADLTLVITDQDRRLSRAMSRRVNFAPPGEGLLKLRQRFVDSPNCA